ncbi:DUF4279 domain-containing protein [Herbidospora sp. RD11066]
MATVIVEQRAYFMIQSEHLDPESITRRLGVTPSRSEVKESKQSRRTGRLVPPRHEWIVDADLPETASLDDQADAVMARLAGTFDRIGELTAEGCEATLVMFRSFEAGPSATKPGLLLTPEMLGLLVTAGAYVWIDEYGFDDD